MARTESSRSPKEPEPRWRVFHLIKGLGRGGAETLLLELQRFAGPRFSYGYGYLLPHKHALAQGLRSAGGDVRCFPARNPLMAALRGLELARFLRRWRARLLHCHLPLTGVVGRMAGSWARIPVVYTEHNLQDRYHPLTRWSNELTWRWQQRVIAVSDEVADSIAAHRYRGVPVEVVRNGVDTVRFRADAGAGARLREELDIPADAPVVGTVAVFRRQKNLTAWLEAAQRVRGELPAARFLMVGDGPLRQDLVARAEYLGLSDCVSWVGLQEDVVPYLSAMDVFLQTSEFEGLPIALLEAMAAERAVVATAVGGVPEVVTADAGILLANAEPTGVAQALIPLLRSAEERSELGQAARRRIESEFGVRKMVERLEALYLQVIDA